MKSSEEKKYDVTEKKSAKRVRDNERVARNWGKTRYVAGGKIEGHLEEERGERGKSRTFKKRIRVMHVAFPAEMRRGEETSIQNTLPFDITGKKGQQSSIHREGERNKISRLYH